jgi:Glycosyltransferase family 87
MPLKIPGRELTAREIHRAVRMALMASSSETPVATIGREKVDLAELSIALVGGLALALTALFICVVPLSGKIAGSRDFGIYWATGQQLAHHADPYDHDAMMRLEHTANMPSGYPVLYMRNPPWGLPLAMPLGFIGLRLGAFLWSLILLGCLLVSVHMLWQLHGRPNNQLHWLGYSFAPALLCLLMGQTSLFALLGFVLFLRLHASRPFWAGVSLWLCALKPHLLLPFFAALLVWILVSRSYKVLAGAAATMIASWALLYFIDPMAWRQYAHMMRVSGIQKEFLPCPSIALRYWISPDTMWLPYLLPALGCVWAVGFYWSRRHAWSWLNDGSLVVLVSVFVAPFCWLFDQALAIPALLRGAYATRARILLVILAAASIAAEVQILHGVNLTSPQYLWASPAWLLWYLVASAFPAHQKDGQASQAALR